LSEAEIIDVSFDEDFRESNSRMMGVLANPGGSILGGMPNKGVSIPELDIHGGVLWGNMKGRGDWKPGVSKLIGTGDMAAAVQFLTKVSKDQSGFTYPVGAAKAASEWLIENNQKIPIGTFSLVGEIHNLSRLNLWNGVEHNKLLVPFIEAMERRHGEGWPLVSSGKREGEEAREEYSEFYKSYDRFLQWKEGRDPIEETEGLTDRQKILVEYMNWVGMGAPGEVGGTMHERSWDLNRFFPMEDTSRPDAHSLFRPSGVSIDPVSKTFGFRFKVAADTPEFLMHLRDRGLTPETLIEFNAEYTLFKEFDGPWLSHLRPHDSEELRSVRKYVGDTLGVDTRDVGMMPEDDPTFTESRVRPPDRTVRQNANAVLKDKIGDALNSLGRGGADSHGWPLSLSPGQVIPGFRGGSDWTVEEYKKNLTPVWDFPEELVNNPADNMPALHEAITQRIYELEKEKGRYDDLLQDGKFSKDSHKRVSDRAAHLQERLGAMADMIMHHGEYLEREDLRERSGAGRRTVDVHSVTWQSHFDLLETFRKHRGVDDK
jgi:hypothetical protein